MTLTINEDPNITEPADGIPSARAAELYRSLEFHPEQDSWHYTGDLEEGRALAERERFVTVTKTADGRATIVLLGDREDPTDEDHAEWGMHEDEEQAWRYAIGAMFGPLDEHNGGIIYALTGGHGVPDGQQVVPTDDPDQPFALAPITAPTPL